MQRVWSLSGLAQIGRKCPLNGRKGLIMVDLNSSKLQKSHFESKSESV